MFPEVPSSQPVEARGSPWKSVEARGSPWRPVEARGSPWKPVEALWKPVEARASVCFELFGLQGDVRGSVGHQGGRLLLRHSVF